MQRTLDTHADTPIADCRPRIALAHDWLCGYRGGEAVLERIANLVQEIGKPDRLSTMFDDGRPLAPTIDSLEHQVSPLRYFPARARRWLLPLYPAAVGSLSRSLARRHRREPIDLLISTSSAAIKGMRAPAGVPHLCYCHAPARYIWSIRDEYAQGRSLHARLRGTGLAAISGWYRNWDRATAAHVTAFLANSAHTAREIERCFGREAAVVHPPVRTEYFTPDASTHREDFWLFVSALEPYKRTDLAIVAAGLADVPIKVVGSGSIADDLRQEFASPGVEFLGRVADETLRDLYRRARLLVFPQIEDFGITAVEAQACGCPVLARRAGGALDSVIDGTTGAFFEDDSPEAVAEAAAQCPDNPAACRANAERFSERAFDDRMRAHIATMLNARA
ncbi:Glycosyltransferase [hydrothermal vent metagenome]|uniref:Glycosyltransferase n=1 Tax=hydrothermal vent metagenome TaxID=652676 RepID=A0A3B1DUA9_9ZZZZ